MQVRRARCFGLSGQTAPGNRRPSSCDEADFPTAGARESSQAISDVEMHRASATVPGGEPYFYDYLTRRNCSTIFVGSFTLDRG